jgi:hypothetical protein
MQSRPSFACSETTLRTSGVTGEAAQVRRCRTACMEPITISPNRREPKYALKTAHVVRRSLANAGVTHSIEAPRRPKPSSGHGTLPCAQRRKRDRTGQRVRKNILSHLSPLSHSKLLRWSEEPWRANERRECRKPRGSSTATPAGCGLRSNKVTASRKRREGKAEPEPMVCPCKSFVMSILTKNEPERT